MELTRRHPLLATLFELEGNPRITVFTEPLWGIPYNLFIPYASVYMLALGVNDVQIGWVTTIGLLVQPIFALMSGAITDRFGRRLTTFIADLLAWSIPCLIWAAAQDVRYFIVAAIFNATWRIPSNSWTCLLVEDARADQLVHIWTWVHIAGLLSAFFAPLAGLLIGVMDLVPAVRILYIFAFVLMTYKGWLLYRYSTETEQGFTRMAETRHQPFFSLLRGYPEVFVRLLRTPQTLVVIGILFVIGVVNAVSGAFWSILVTENLAVPAENLPIFTFAKSVLMLLLYFVLVPRVDLKRFRNPMMVGLLGMLAANLILVAMPPGNYALLLLSVLLEAFSLALFGPLLESLVVVSIDAAERARINAILAVVVILLTSPFGWIAGQLSSIDRTLPFLMNMGMFGLGMVFVWLAWRMRGRA